MNMQTAINAHTAMPSFVPPIPLGADVESDGLIYNLVGRDEINGNLLVRFGEMHFWAPADEFKIAAV